VADRVEVNRAIIAEFRANGGEVSQFAGVPLLLLTTTGARSGEPRTSPMMYALDGDRHVVYGTNGGRDIDPAWVHNLRADPRAVIEVGVDRLEVAATFTEGDEHARLWDRAVEQNPTFADFTARTDRPIPVIVLDRR
jgi:deazaflavin-dependent oxidoreductase (nitroreductase family)